MNTEVCVKKAQEVRVWAPPIEDFLTQQLTAVKGLENQQQIHEVVEYLNLLADRVAWMIREWVNQDVGRTEQDAFQLIATHLHQGKMMSLWLPSLADSIEVWAENLTLYNAYLHEALLMLCIQNPTRTVLFDFPVQLTQEREDLIKVIQETDLEAWLTQLVNVCKGDPV